MLPPRFLPDMLAAGSNICYRDVVFNDHKALALPSQRTVEHT